MIRTECLVVSGVVGGHLATTVYLLLMPRRCENLRHARDLDVETEFELRVGSRVREWVGDACQSGMGHAALFKLEKRLPRFVKSDTVKQELKTRIGAQGIKKGVYFGEL